MIQPPEQMCIRETTDEVKSNKKNTRFNLKN